MGVLSILYNKYYTAILFLLIVIMPFVLFLILCYCRFKIKAELMSTVHIANKGEELPITIRLSNPTIFPVSYINLYLSYKNAYLPKKYKKTVAVSLDCRTKTSYVCSLTSEYAGNIIVSLEGIRFFDYLKLFSMKRKQTEEIKTAVLPTYYELEQNYLTNKNSQLVESDNYSPVKKGDDPSEVFEIREYREGDRLQRIHWKLSSKLNQLMIKDFSDPVNYCVLIFVDFGVPNQDNSLFYIDAVLECALSLSYSFLLRKQLHILSWYDQEHGTCKRVHISDEKDLFEAVDGLLQASLYGKEIDASLFYLAEYPHEQYTDLFIITGKISRQWVDSISVLKAQDKQIIYLEDRSRGQNLRNSEEELIQQSMEDGISVWSIDIRTLCSDMQELFLS